MEKEEKAKKTEEDKERGETVVAHLRMMDRQEVKGKRGLKEGESKSTNERTNERTGARRPGKIIAEERAIKENGWMDNVNKKERSTTNKQ